MISIVIPVYRSALILPKLYGEIKVVMDTLLLEFEVIFVEDCGGDNSWAAIEELCREYINVRGIQLSRNYGQHNALLCGIRIATGDTIVTMDDDLQHQPSDLPKLLNKLAEGYDVVYATPQKQMHGVLRNFASVITKLILQGTMGASNAKDVSAYRLFRAYLREAFVDYKNPMVSIDVLLTWGTSNFSSVKVNHALRSNGKSGYSFSKLIQHALNMITGFSTLPLQIASIMGLCFALFGFFILLYVIFMWLTYGSQVPGFAFLSSLVAIFAGVQLLALGVIGEYMSRMYARTMGKPSYTVRTTVPSRLN